MDLTKDYYEILGLEESASYGDIKRAYRLLAKQYHPDINRDPRSSETFKLLSEAYETLSDDGMRAQYDSYRMAVRYTPDSDNTGNANNGATYQETEEQKGPIHDAYADTPANKRSLKIFIISLIVPGLYQVHSGDNKLGYFLFIIYFIFWALSLTQNLAIGLLAILIWLYSIYDAYSRVSKTMKAQAGVGQ